LEFQKELKHRRNFTGDLFVSIVDYFRDDTFTNVIVLDGGGGSLHDKLLQRTPGRSECRMLFEAVLDVIECVHSKNKIVGHMDPSNLVFSDNGTLVLFDTQTLFSEEGGILIYPPSVVSPETCMLLPPEIAKQSIASSRTPDQEMLISCRKTMDLWGLGLVLADLCGVSEMVHGVSRGALRKNSKIELDSQSIVERILKFHPSHLAEEKLDIHARSMLEGLLHPKPAHRFKFSDVKVSDWLDFVKKENAINSIQYCAVCPTSPRQPNNDCPCNSQDF
jgi:serine/threonine protein kinase